MYKKMKARLLEHVKKNLKIYVSLLSVFALGVVIGAITVNSLPSDKKDDLADYLLGFLQLYDKQEVNGTFVFLNAFLGNVRMTLILWVLGAAIVGIPFIYGIITFRGFVTGFTSGFIIWSAGTQGILFCVTGLLFGEILLLPCYLALATNGISFSLGIIRSKHLKEDVRLSLKDHFLRYSLVTLGVIACLAVVSAIQSWVIPLAVRLVL